MKSGAEMRHHTNGCLFCGGDAGAPDHRARCDGRQGAVEAREPFTFDGCAFALPSVAIATADRDAAIDQVVTHAERDRPTFQRDASAFVIRYLRQHGATPGEVLTIACKRSGIVPHDDRAFGAVYLSLVRQRVIERVATVPRLRGHRTAGGNVWALAG